MKNSKLRSVLFSLAVMASIGSYLYLNSVKTGDCTAKCEKQEQVLEQQGNAELPDVLLLKKIIEKGKQLMPATKL